PRPGPGHHPARALPGGRGRARPALPGRAPPGALPVRAVARGRPGRRGPGTVPRLRPGHGEDRHLRDLGGDGRAGGRAVRAGRRAHLARAARRRAVAGARRGGRGGRPVRAGRRGARRGRHGIRADGLQRAVRRRLALPPRRAVHPRHDPRPAGDRRAAEQEAGVTDALLEIRGLRAVFDGFAALDGVDLTVEEGELRFLIGPNGAGKTTLIDVITGLTRPAAGTVRFAGTDLAGRRE